MLGESRLPTYFWDEVVNTIWCTQNFSLINQAQGTTPYQLFKEKKPTINFVHVFKCKYFVLRNQGEHLEKFESKIDEAIFVGYATKKAYKVYSLRVNIVMEYVHVVYGYKKIQGLVDEGFHDILKFENEVEIILITTMKMNKFKKFTILKMQHPFFKTYFSRFNNFKILLN